MATIAEQTLTREDALARGKVLIEEIRALLKKAKAKPKKLSYEEMLAILLAGTSEGAFLGWETRRRGGDIEDTTAEWARVSEPARGFQHNEGYDWHEAQERIDWATALPYEESTAIDSYAGFSYGDINGLLRGSYEPPTVTEVVRAATPEEIAAHDARGAFGKSDARNYDPDDPTNKVADGRLIHNVFTRDENDNPVEWSVQREVPDTKRVKVLEAHATKINNAIREHGYELPEPMKVNRAAYIPGMSYDDLKALEGATIEEKGFSSTMVGDPSHRLDGYVAGAKFESIHRRHGDDKGYDLAKHQDEVGAAMRIEIVVPKGTKVIPVETVRRLEYEFPRIPDPSPRPADVAPEHWTMRDLKAKPTATTKMLKDPKERHTRAEAEILLGSGAQFRIVSVQRGARRITHSDPKLKAVDVIDVKMEYVGGGSSEGTP